MAFKGIILSDGEAGLHQLEKISTCFETFLKEISQYNEVARSEEENLTEVATETAKMRADYRDIVELVKECKMLIKKNEGLVLRQASLALSLSQLKMSKELKDEGKNGNRSI